MYRTVSVQLLYLAALSWMLSVVLRGEIPNWLVAHERAVVSTLAGGLGGVVYCLRGVYLSACVRRNWDPAWFPWYLIRPLVSLCCGLVGYVFLKAGLLLLDATIPADSAYLGFYALAFIAGYNVDRFLEKIEGIAHAAWGIERSRASKDQS